MVSAPRFFRIIFLSIGPIDISINMSFFKALKNLSETISKFSDPDEKKFEEKEGKAVDEKIISDSSHAKGKDGVALHKGIHGMRCAVVMFNGQKYAVLNPKKKKSTPYIYDDVMVISKYHLILVQISPDGEKRYAVLTAHSRNDNFKITPFDYIDFDFYDEDAVLVVDEDNDEYVVNDDGDISAKDIFLKNLEEYLSPSDDDDDDDDD